MTTKSSGDTSQKLLPQISLRNLVSGILVKEKTKIFFMFVYFFANAAIVYWLSAYLVTRTPYQVYANPTIILYFRLLVMASPLIIGLLIGVPLLSSEYQSGSYRFLFTQGAGRRRLLKATLGIYLLSILLFSMMTIVSVNHFLSVQQEAQSIAKQTSETISIWSFGVFIVHPIILVPLTLTGFTAGVLLGAIFKRLIPGIAAALLFGVMFALGLNSFFDVLLSSFVQELYDSPRNGFQQHYDFNGHNDPKYLFLFQIIVAASLIFVAGIFGLCSLRVINNEGVLGKHHRLHSERSYT
jgi:hypothetical protein